MVKGILLIKREFDEFTKESPFGEKSYKSMQI